MRGASRAWWPAALALPLLMLWAGATAASSLPQDLADLSLEDLGNVVVSSVARSPEPLSDAPAAVFVIGHDEIMRSGATSLPEILRLAPNLEVFRTSPSGYTITARGFSGNDAAQNFSNKLLVLIDGRSVYSPIFSGMYWDDQFVLPQDIERIEVVSGPGGALWGANAVNGVINIITRSADQTQGGRLTAAVGNREHGASAQYGGRLGRSAYYRLYAHDWHRAAFDNASGQDAQDDWRKRQLGFRLDWDAGAVDALMVQGDLHDGYQGQAGSTDARSTEGDLLARWEHTISGTASLRVQAYYDHVHRWDEATGSGFSLDTSDLEMQHTFSVGERQRVTWGGGDRMYHYDIVPRIAAASSLLWDPAVNTQHLTNAFIQDRVRLGRQTTLTLGLKAEDDPYAGVSLMPSTRLSWKPSADLMVWAAASRAVRTPTPFDEDVVEKLGTATFLTGNPAFRREKLTAYEAGWRQQFGMRATISMSLYYNFYDDLKTIELSPTGLPLLWGNAMEGHTYGVETWGSYAVRDGWRLGAGFTSQRQHLRFKPGASRLLGVAQAGDDPTHYGFIRSMINLSDHWTLDADLRGVGALPDPKVPGYVELNARLGWRVSDTLQFSLSGFNLLHPWHQERGFPGADRIGRSVTFDTRVTF